MALTLLTSARQLGADDGDVVIEKTRLFLEEQERVCLPKPFALGEFREAIAKMLASS